MNKFLKKKEAFERIVKSKPVFQEIDRDRKRKKGKKKYIKWYEVCSNVINFKGLMTDEQTAGSSKESGTTSYFSEKEEWTGSGISQAFCRSLRI